MMFNDFSWLNVGFLSTCQVFFSPRLAIELVSHLVRSTKFLNFDLVADHCRLWEFLVGGLFDDNEILIFSLHGLGVEDMEPAYLLQGVS